MSTEKTTRFAPHTDEQLYSTRPEAVHAIHEILGSYADDFDVDAIADELIEWHTCYTERDGKTVEWLPGNGFYIQQFADDVEREDAQSFWELVANHAYPTADELCAKLNAIEVTFEEAVADADPDTEEGAKIIDVAQTQWQNDTEAVFRKVANLELTKVHCTDESWDFVANVDGGPKLFGFDGNRYRATNGEHGGWGYTDLPEADED